MAADGNRWRHHASRAAEPGDPHGELVAVPERGTWTGNRGVLHDGDRRIVRPWQDRRWIVCRLEFKGRHRRVMAPGRWTELFFLDEVTALAAGHRPCAECRRAAFAAFAAAWPHRQRRAPEIDDVLHRERLGPRPPVADLVALPDGAMVAAGPTAYLVADGGLRPWSPAGYGPAVTAPADGPLVLLTPPSTVAAIASGYRPGRAGPAAR